MAADQLTTWAQRLNIAARATLGQDLALGIKETIDGPTGSLRMARLVAGSLGGNAAIDFTPSTLDEKLWASLAGLGDVPELPKLPTGGITGQPTGEAIEVWTEIELASVHAAWSLGKAWRAETSRAAAWLIEHIQPDNATNRPWAVHVFASLAHELGDPSYELYAQTLLHNCQVTSGKPDPFSAMILLHSANQLQAC